MDKKGSVCDNDILFLNNFLKIEDSFNDGIKKQMLEGVLEIDLDFTRGLYASINRDFYAFLKEIRDNGDSAFYFEVEKGVLYFVHDLVPDGWDVGLTVRLKVKDFVADLQYSESAELIELSKSFRDIADSIDSVEKTL